MLDSFEVVTVSGVVLWSKTFAPVGINVVNSLIQDIFIQGNTTSIIETSAARIPTYKKDKYTLKWTTAKDLGLIFVAVYQSLVHLTWIDTLLDNVKALFIGLYAEQFKKPHTSDIECPFDPYFDRQLQELEKTTEEHGPHIHHKPTIGSEAEDPETILRPPTRLLPGSNDTSTDVTPLPTPDSSRPASPGGQLLAAKFGPAGRASRKSRQRTNASTSSSRDISSSTPKTEKSTIKKGRKWDDHGLMDEDDGKVLDYSSNVSDGHANSVRPNLAQEPISQDSWGKRTNKGEFVLKDLDEEMDSILTTANAKQQAEAAAAAASVHSDGLMGSSLGVLAGLFNNVVGGKALTEEDLLKPLAAMRDHLIKKNVASEAAGELCDAVKQKLIGTKTPTFQSMNTTVRSAMDRALSQILTPTTSLDLLRSIQAVARSTGKRRPFVISVVGVNGVGKSTTLSKLAFLLLHNNLRVLVCAADTFRSGAIQQLEVHVNRLKELTDRAAGDDLGQIDLFDMGYGKDAGHVAQKAVEFAAAPPKDKMSNVEEPYDVVLIDTAGRQHNDARLMSSLETFARLAKPDKILMVSEALAGTDSVAQAKHFNAAFGKDRTLDGFIVSKCDTVGQEVGTLVSLVKSTGVPIIAVGVGQHYGDLRGFNVGWARDLLLMP